MATWDLTGTQHHLLICNGGSCMRAGGEDVTQAIRNEIAAHHADALIHTTRTRCNGRCEDACVVISYPAGRWYKDMTPEAGRALVRDHLGDVSTDLHNQTVYTYVDKCGFVPAEGAAVGRCKL
ncbi:(2Fe-2S) ferredoxin domain-containing protein [Aneurinibacillus uraniidurans]|uniref:(2Fe-2S) ferredoxin domain-containing protein n=1 Tax=Aneurinibacillus uraniidurans TaxID=2966586 RepID=UPI00234C016F|nr:(2Fe-2S) ferredoxin domain-containing protein [Aneurinibacillus sp. B1]WCN38815.1 (2Fe-2S) ferredoxin domain-containing protein [Aneurinibacillus sp. B1]